ncbi:hypothetical protein NPIL_571611 [Nephila pilipes]|uniref:Uncharacterized protein n=1 Tax=Nephila pilipes TaxID=299642 RepID=A0A8X6PMA7_NEPPI|nr:hypothetical protein NPIL_571611 [Nephila pilipes]
MQNPLSYYLSPAYLSQWSPKDPLLKQKDVTLKSDNPTMSRRREKNHPQSVGMGFYSEVTHIKLTTTILRDNMVAVAANSAATSPNYLEFHCYREEEEKIFHSISDLSFRMFYLNNL